MKIVTLTAIYNEAFLLPFYLRHYEWCDEHYFLYETNSTDRGIDLLRGNEKFQIYQTTFTGGIDDVQKSHCINGAYRALMADVVICVDADEFVFTNREEVESLMWQHPAVYVEFCDVYRHHTESDLDLSVPIRDQRRHGVRRNEYQKPAIVRTKLPENVTWTIGNHGLNNETPADCGILGAHWANADPCFSIKRRARDRSERMSHVNYENHYGTQHYFLTDAQVRQKLADHSYDTQLW